MSTKVTNEEILNAVRQEASSDYQSHVPMATAENQVLIGQTLTTNQSLLNEFVRLLNRVGRTIIADYEVKNPLAEFMMELPFGASVAEWQVNLAKAEAYDPYLEGNDLYKLRIPDVAELFHNRRIEEKYPATLFKPEIRKAFLTESGIYDYYSRIAKSLYDGDRFDIYKYMKELVSEVAGKGGFYTITIPDINSKEAAEQAAVELRAISGMMEFVSTKYNSMKRDMATPISEQIIITTPRTQAYMDVNVLANAFQMDKAEVLARTVVIDDFNMPGVLFAVVDRRWFQCYSTYKELAVAENASQAYFNMFWHHHKILSTTAFRNAVLFVSGQQTIDTYALTPATATVEKGGYLQVYPIATGENYPSARSTYAITGQASKNTVMMENGLLIVGKDETAKTITITGTSEVDTSKTATCVVTIAGN